MIKATKTFGWGSVGLSYRHLNLNAQKLNAPQDNFSLDHNASEKMFQIFCPTRI